MKGTRPLGGEGEARVVYVPRECWDGDVATITGDEHHHIVHVLRRRAGDRIEAVDGMGSRAVLEIVSADRRQARCAVVSCGALEARPGIEIRLIPCVARPARMDWLIEKVTELGVVTITPVYSARSIVRVDAARAAQQSARWRRLAVAAMKQSRRAWLPSIELPLGLAELMAGWRHDERLIVPWEEARSGSLRDRLVARPLPCGERVAVLIGPEGGLDPEEVELCRSAGGEVVGLGPSILRAETAGIVVSAILLYEGGAI